MKTGSIGRLTGLVLWGAMSAGLGDPAGQDETAPPYTITETEIQLPGVTVSRETREVRIEATACLESGLLEYVVCEPNSFEHESIFTTNTRPELVHAALLLAGLKPTPQVRGLTELWWEKAMKQEQSRVKIEVEWEEEGQQKRVALSSLLRKRERQEGAPGDKAEGAVQDAWVFAGSFMQAHPETGKRFYAANATGILVGIWPDPSTVIQYGLPNGNPYEGEELGMEINEEAVPKEGTKVRLVFFRPDPPKDGAGER